MTEKDIREYRTKKQEMADIDRQLRELKLNKGDELIVSDVILNYNTGYPKAETITGIDQARLISVSKKRSIYLTAYMKLSESCAEVEEFVEQIPDAEIRRIIRLRYIQGLTQADIARRMCLDQGNISRKINNFLKEL